MIRLAFGSVPKDGGTFTFYRNMRPQLLQHGIDLRCVALGKEQAELWETAYVDEGCVLLAATTRSIKKQAMAFANWCETEQIDVVMGINSEAILSALPYLPQRIRCMSRCANSFDHGYRITLSGYERLAGIVAQTPRQLKDLTESYGADAEKITVIPNGIDPAPFKAGAEGRTTSDEARPLRLGFLGRLEHNQKGVLFLPKIVAELNRLGIHYTLRIAGKGKHEGQLRKELAAEDSSQASRGGEGRAASASSSTIQFLGALPPSEIPAFLAETDVFLFPSQFEGCPNALLEAMLAGCAPVAWKLEGITDFIIEAGVSGCIVPLGDHVQFAACIAEFERDRQQLQLNQLAATRVTTERFRTEIAAANYAKTIHRVMERPAPEWTPLPWSRFRGDPNFAHSWKDWVPSGLKNKLRSILSA